MNILVTGCAGYVGSTLVPHLLSCGHSVTGIDSLLHGGEGMLGFYGNPLFRFVNEDVTSPDLGKYFQPGTHAVIHLAALVGEPQCSQAVGDGAFNVNVNAVENLLEISKSQGVQKFLFASTCSNYGVQDPDVLATEESILNPQGLYAETKIAAEEIVLNTDGIDVTVMRFATVFGLSPRMRFDLLLNELCRDAEMKRYLDIWGPDSWRPFVHVRDLARYVETLCAIGRCTGIYNIGSFNIQKSAIAKMLKDIVPGLEVDFTTGKNDPRDYRVSFEKLEAVLGIFSDAGGIVGDIVRMLNAIKMRFFDDPFSRRYRNI